MARTTKPAARRHDASSKVFEERLSTDAIRSEIVESILSSLRNRTDAAGYTQSEGKNYGKYEKGAVAREELADLVERAVERVIQRELRGKTTGR